MTNLSLQMKALWLVLVDRCGRTACSRGERNPAIMWAPYRLQQKGYSAQAAMGNSSANKTSKEAEMASAFQRLTLAQRQETLARLWHYLDKTSEQTPPRPANHT
ncbi:hypothetical protein FKM82_022056 [Ascaphus truei]